MLVYTLKRLALAVAVTLVVSALSFGLLYLSGDPAAAIGGEAATDADISNIRKIYGLDRPPASGYEMSVSIGQTPSAHVQRQPAPSQDSPRTKPRSGESRRD